MKDLLEPRWSATLTDQSTQSDNSKHYQCMSEWVSSVLRPLQHSIGYMGDVLQVKRPNRRYQSTEGNATKEKENNENN